MACDLSGATSGPTGGFNNKINTTAPPNAGKILEFTYTPSGARMRTDVAALQQYNFSIYPNPAQNKITIQSGVNKALVIEVFNMVGARVKAIRTSGSRFDVDLKGLANGTYSVRVSDNQGKVYMIQKVVKQ